MQQELRNRIESEHEEVDRLKGILADLENQNQHLESTSIATESSDDILSIELVDENPEFNHEGLSPLVEDDRSSSDGSNDEAEIEEL
uniref:Uncharacterized protein n=1 Tax=Ciona savignyi TaxID=51511 RepID=H2Y923_CIOSA